MLEIDILRDSSQKYCGILKCDFGGLGALLAETARDYMI